MSLFVLFESLFVLLVSLVVHFESLFVLLVSLFVLFESLFVLLVSLFVLFESLFVLFQSLFVLFQSLFILLVSLFVLLVSLFVLFESLYRCIYTIINAAEFSSFFFLYTYCLPMLRCPRGVMVNTMDCWIVVSEFVLQPRYYIHFRANTLGKGMNPLIPPPAMG